MKIDCFKRFYKITYISRKETKKAAVSSTLYYCRARFPDRKAGLKNKTAVHSGMADCRNGSGPHALSLMNQQILDASWYQTAVHVLECAVGLMIGTELVWNKLKRSGRTIIITTLTQSVGTFLLVSLVFGIVFTFRAFRFTSLSFSAELRLRRLRPPRFPSSGNLKPPAP